MELDLYVEKTSVNDLRPSTTANLSKLLNGESGIDGTTGYFSNYLGLAELAGFNNGDISILENSENPTQAFLDEWQHVWATKVSTRSRVGPTIGDLWKFLRQLGRMDVIQNLHNHVCEDVKSVREYLSEDGEFENILIDLKTNKKKFYDAFLACDEVEGELIRFLTELLETKLKIRLFVEQRDMDIGVSRYPAIAYIMRKRCSKLLCCITNKFIQSPHCNFLVRFAQHLSPDGAQQRIIPLILDKNAEVPSILAFLVKLNIVCSPMTMDAFTQQESWERLAKIFNQKVHKTSVSDSTSQSKMSCPAIQDTVMSSRCSCNSSNPGSDDTQQIRDEGEPSVNNGIHRATNSKAVDQYHNSKTESKVDNGIHRATNGQAVDQGHNSKTEPTVDNGIHRATNGQAVDQGHNSKTAKRRRKPHFSCWRR